MAKQAPDDYLSFLLRLWREEGVEWRASLHDPDTGERLGFASVDELFAFLEGRMGIATGTAEGQEEGRERG